MFRVFFGRSGLVLRNLERDLHGRAAELQDTQRVPRVPREQRVRGVVCGDPGVQSFFASRYHAGPLVPKEERG